MAVWIRLETDALVNMDAWDDVVVQEVGQGMFGVLVRKVTPFTTKTGNLPPIVRPVAVGPEAYCQAVVAELAERVVMDARPVLFDLTRFPRPVQFLPGAPYGPPAKTNGTGGADAVESADVVVSIRPDDGEPDRPTPADHPDGDLPGRSS